MTTTHPLPTTRATTAKDQALNSVFTTALEGGIGYWSACSLYRWSVDGTLDGTAKDFIAVVTDVEDDESPEYVIDRAVIVRGITRFYEHMRGLSQEGTANRYQWQAAKDLHHGKWEDVDYDADTADMIVQFGLLGEQRYS